MSLKVFPDSDLRCRVLKLLPAIASSADIIKKSKILPLIRFPTIIIIASMCERGSAVYFQNSGDGMKGTSGIVVSKIITKLCSCVYRGVKRLCEFCSIKETTVLDVLKKLDVPTNKERDLSRLLMSDFRKILHMLSRQELDLETEARVRKFLNSLYSGNLHGMFISYIELITHLLNAS